MAYSISMTKAVISGDIISSTGLSDAGRVLIENSLKELLVELKNAFDVYGHIIKGDYLECVLADPKDALQIALAIKCYVKSVPIENTLTGKMNKRIRQFKTHGIRLAIGYGELSRFLPEKGIIDGEAIYLSGRTISESASYNKERIVIKNSLYFVSNDELLNKQLDPVIALVDVLLSKATARQSEVLFLKLMNNNEDAIATKLQISQSVVNQHSTTAGWNAIDKAVKYFREVLKNR